MWPRCRPDKYNQPTVGYLATPPSQLETSHTRCQRFWVWVSPEPWGFRWSAPSHTVHTEPVKRQPHLTPTNHLCPIQCQRLPPCQRGMVKWRDGYILKRATNSWHTYAGEWTKSCVDFKSFSARMVIALNHNCDNCYMKFQHPITIPNDCDWVW